MKPMLLAKSETLILNDDWSLELKFDGIRAILHMKDDSVKIETRNEKDITVSFPEIVEDAKRMFHEDVILDGEIVGYDTRGIHKLNYVQHRLGVKDPAKIAHRQQTFPVVYVVFDVLHAGNRDLYHRSLTDRRKVLGRLIPDRTAEIEANAKRFISVAQVYPVSMMDQLWAFIQDQNLEGLVAKRRESKYRPGTRSPQWLKIKHHKMKVKEG